MKIRWGTLAAIGFMAAGWTELVRGHADLAYALMLTAVVAAILGTLEK